MLKYFESHQGRYIEKIIGQDRLAFAQSCTEDFYDMIAWAQRGGYQGSVITFYDFETGGVYEPFPKQRDVVYGNPVYADGWYHFLQGDFNRKKITLYRFAPGEPLTAVTALSTEEVSLYNLRIIGSPVHIIAQGERFSCYYPRTMSFDIFPEETVLFIENGRVYSEKWVEEGWDEENHRATDDYRYYHKVIVRDFSGKVLSEEIGGLYQAPDGTWWVT